MFRAKRAIFGRTPLNAFLLEMTSQNQNGRLACKGFHRGIQWGHVDLKFRHHWDSCWSTHMVSPVEQIQLKITRSKRHLGELQNQVSAFFASAPYQVATKRDPGTGQLIYFVSRVEEVPLMIAVVAGDLMQNLRSALDHLAYRLVLAGTAGATPVRHVYFPIADSVEKYEEIKGSFLAGVRPEAIMAIDAVKPYWGGTDALWRLHKLNIIDKHRLLLMVGSAFRSFDLGAVMQRQMEKSFLAWNQERGIQLPPFLVRPGDRMFPLKINDELFTDLPEAEPNEKVKFNFEVSFQEPEADVRNGEPLVETLAGLITVVEGAINQVAPLI